MNRPATLHGGPGRALGRLLESGWGPVTLRPVGPAFAASSERRPGTSADVAERERAEARGDHHGDADIERCRHGIEESRDEGVMCCGDQLMRHRRWQAGGELQLGSAAAKLVTTLEGGAETGDEPGPRPPRE